MATAAFNILNSENKTQCILWWIHSGPFCLFSSCKKSSQKHFQFFCTLKSKRILVHLCNKFSTFVLPCFPWCLSI